SGISSTLRRSPPADRGPPRRILRGPMKDVLRLLRYVRPYTGRLAAAVACSILLSVIYLGLLGLIQPILDEVLPRNAIAPAATAGKLHLFEPIRRLLGPEGALAPLTSWAGRR